MKDNQKYQSLLVFWNVCTSTCDPKDARKSGIDAGDETLVVDVVSDIFEPLKRNDEWHLGFNDQEPIHGLSSTHNIQRRQ